MVSTIGFLHFESNDDRLHFFTDGLIQKYTASVFLS